MKVKIRVSGESTDDARLIGEVPLDQASLDAVIPLLNRWGVYDNVGGVDYDDASEMVGQVVLTANDAYFEIVLGEE